MSDIERIIAAIRGASPEERAAMREALFPGGGEEPGIAAEHERLRGLFAGVDENQLALADGAIWEAARIRDELDALHGRVKESGLVKFHPNAPSLQKVLPVARELPKLRAGYANIIFKLMRVLGTTVDEEDLGLGDYE